METSNCRHFTLRLNYNNAEHCEVLDILDGLNLDVYKSKNQYIMNAIKYYYESICDGSYFAKVNEEYRQKKENQNLNMDKIREEIKNSCDKLREEFHRDTIQTLEVALLTAGMGRGEIDNRDMNTEQRNQGRGGSMAGEDAETDLSSVC